MTAARGKTIGLIGGLSAFPRRLAVREVARQGGRLLRGVTRSTTHLVFGRALLARAQTEAIEARYDAGLGGGRVLLGENGFLRLLGLKPKAEAGALSAQSLREQSLLSERDLALLALFDAFEHEAEPFSFRDLILAKKYAGLLAGGASWASIVRSIHRVGPATSLTALTLHVEDGDAIYARHREGLSELDGQWLLPMEAANDAEVEDLFEQAEAAEAKERYAEAAELYRRSLALDPDDAIAAFNRANCLRAGGDAAGAMHGYLLAVKLDPKLAEAWFNLAGLARDGGQPESARRHFLAALNLDAGYGDAVYNLAALEYDAGNLPEARRLWSRYLELDDRTQWARIAARGIQYVDLHLAQRNAG